MRRSPQWSSLIVLSLTGWILAPLVIASELDSRKQTLTLLKQAVQQHRGESPTDLAELNAAADQARELLGPDHYAAKMLGEGQSQAGEIKDSANRSQKLRALLSEVHESLSFSPVIEAKLPEDYPAPTPLHAIEVKELPKYRLARVTMGQGKGQAGENGAFWTLFQHIKRNDIAMTAPVEMEFQADGPRPVDLSMAFLYRSTDLGSVGTDPKNSKVEVTDVEPVTVVSLGCRGSMNDREVAAAEQKLRVWLAAHPEYFADGAPRKLGYNSPFIPGFMRYFEVQIPVKPARDVAE